MNKNFKDIEESLKILNEFNDSSDLNKMIKLYENTGRLIKKTSIDIDNIEKKLNKNKKKKLYNIKNNNELINFISKFNILNEKIKSIEDINKLININNDLNKIYNSIIYYLQNKNLDINYIN
mgnify:CR=1 FL=1|jgi:hypothetical protein